MKMNLIKVKSINRKLTTDHQNKEKRLSKEEERDWINAKDIKPRKVYANIKIHKENNPYHFIVSFQNTVIEYLLLDRIPTQRIFEADYTEKINTNHGPFPTEKYCLLAGTLLITTQAVGPTFVLRQ